MDLFHYYYAHVNMEKYNLIGQILSLFFKNH